MSSAPPNGIANRPALLHPNPNMADAPTSPVSRSLLRRLYDWTLHWAETKWATLALGVIAFLESSFFPIPPDVLLIAMSFAQPRKWWIHALVCTIGSVAGGILGWYIGFALYETVGVRIIEFFHYQEAYRLVGEYYQENAFLYILGAAFTPIPYKVFTIAAGVFHEQVGLPVLIGASIAGRGGRFFIVALLIRLFGARVKPLLEKHFDLLALLFFVLLVLGFLAIKLL